MYLITKYKELQEAVHKLPPNKRQWFALGMAAIFAFILMLAVFTIPIVNVLEWKIVDSWIQVTGDSKPTDDIAIIGIDDLFLRNQQWPLDKSVYAGLIDYLNVMGAKVIVIDVLFSHNQDNCKSDGPNQGDLAFQYMLDEVPNIILIFTPTNLSDTQEDSLPIVPIQYAMKQGTVPGCNINEVVLPYPELLQTQVNIAHHGIMEPFRDGAYRGLPLIGGSNGYLYPAISLLAVSLFLDTAEIVWENGGVSVGSHRVVVDDKTNMLYSFKHKIPFYTMFDISKSMDAYYRILDGDTLDGDPPQIIVGKEELSDKIVFIGASDPLLGDNALSPMSARYNGDIVPKVKFHARSSATLLSDSAIKYFGRWSAILFSFCVVLVMLLLFKLRQVMFCYFTFLGVAIACYVGGGYLYYLGYLFPIAEGLVTGVAFTLIASLIIFFEKDQARSFLFDSFKTYLSKEVIDDMYANRIKPKLGGSEGIRTAYFTDIQSFSTFSEKIGSPTRLVELLNEYLSAMTDILLENMGTLDKYEGDAIIAFYGAPMEMPDHAFKACKTGLLMQAKLVELREKWKSEGDKWPEIVHNMRMRIGINTGPIVTGNMGSHVRMNYTMMGDAVNLAARLESGAKQYGVFSLVSDETMKSAGDGVYGRLIDVIRVIGKSQPVKIYEILCMKETVTPEQEKCVSLFEKGRKLYLERKWEDAIKIFEECLDFEPHHPDRNPGCKTTPSHVYISRSKAYLIDPPGNDWDGIFTATSK
ncbi:MAG: adenylate/guanylate cyclase domain-containing protein [Fibrobacteria bacterium]|nr:adenylate/guanylate cyclase domain-containing protein [Fibrobacteria bacterium]